MAALLLTIGFSLIIARLNTTGLKTALLSLTVGMAAPIAYALLYPVIYMFTFFFLDLIATEHSLYLKQFDMGKSILRIITKIPLHIIFALFVSFYYKKLFLNKESLKGITLYIYNSRFRWLVFGSLGVSLIFTFITLLFYVFTPPSSISLETDTQHKSVIYSDTNNDQELYETETTVYNEYDSIMKENPALVESLKNSKGIEKSRSLTRNDTILIIFLLLTGAVVFAVKKYKERIFPLSKRVKILLSISAIWSMCAVGWNLIYNEWYFEDALKIIFVPIIIVLTSYLLGNWALKETKKG